MQILYTATSTYDEIYDENESSWNSFIEWSRLYQLTELISLDSILNDSIVKPNFDNDDDWNFIYKTDNYLTGFFTELDYVLSRIQPKDRFNLLALVIEPETDCAGINIDNFEFVGFELLDMDCAISALSNCGGFDETFLPSELNDKGLINDYEIAYEIKKRLKENNPDESHADTFVIAIWRHRTIGR